MKCIRIFDAGAGGRPRSGSPRGLLSSFPRAPTHPMFAAVVSSQETVPSRVIAPPDDALLIAMVDSELHAGETARAREGFVRKEAELRAAFAQLSVMDQRALHTRLSNPRCGNQLAECFGRLTAERRLRLLTFLADARRREALARANNR